MPTDGDRGPVHRRRVGAPVEEALGSLPGPDALVPAGPLSVSHQGVVLSAGVNSFGAVGSPQVDEGHLSVLDWGETAAVNIWKKDSELQNANRWQVYSY